MDVPFTRDQFFDVLAAYNRALWPLALALWAYAVGAAAVFAVHSYRRTRFAAAMLAVQWIWAGVAYHAMFFSDINPAAWLFSTLFVVEGGLLVWFGVVHEHLRFSPTGSLRHIIGWTLIIYSLLYPVLAQIEGHVYPRGPTFGVPCPTTLLTIGWLLVAEAPWPTMIALIPVGWALVGGSAAVLFGVRTDFMLWAAGIVLAASMLFPARHVVRA